MCLEPGYNILFSKYNIIENISTFFFLIDHKARQLRLFVFWFCRGEIVGL